MPRYRSVQKSPPTIIEDLRYPNHPKRYECCKHLGQGGFANVYEVKSLDTGNIYACKIVNKSNLRKNEHKIKVWCVSVCFSKKKNRKKKHKNKTKNKKQKTKNEK